MARLIRFLNVLFFVLITSSAQASHIFGGDLSYSWVSGNTYNVSLTLFGDCGGAAFSLFDTYTPMIHVYDGGSCVDSFLLPVNNSLSGIEVTPSLCQGYLSTCNDLTSQIPGIKVFAYSATYTLPRLSASWRFIFAGSMPSILAAGRSANITNIIGGSTMALTATLNNKLSHNTSPTLSIRQPYFNINSPAAYNPGAVDADGDSLTYQLVPAKNSTGGGLPFPDVDYVAPFSGTMPIQATFGTFIFDQATGQMNFTPNMLQRADVVYNISEYRGGALAGTMQREISVITFAYPSHAPSGIIANSTNGVITSPTNIDVCDTMTNFSLEIHLLDTTFHITKITPSGLPAGAVFNTVNDSTHNPVGTFSWDLTDITPGSYTFYVEFRNNACPVSGINTIAYTITFVPCDVLTTSPIVNDAAHPITICPNPSNGSFRILADQLSDNVTITIIDMYGKIVTQEKVDKTAQEPFNVYHLQNGAYTVHINSGNKVYCEKLIICR